MEKKRQFCIVIEVFKTELLEQGKHTQIDEWTVGRAIRDAINTRPLSCPFNLLSCAEIEE